MRIGFDLDGVLVDIYSVIRWNIQCLYNIKIPKNPPTWQIAEGQLTSNEVWLAIRKAYQDTSSQTIYPGVRPLMKALWEYDQSPITIVTARPFYSASDTFKVVERIFKKDKIPFTLIFKHPRLDKADHLSGFTHFVEDRKRTAIHLAGLGMKVFLINKSYNQLDKDYSGITVVENMTELLRIL